MDIDNIKNSNDYIMDKYTNRKDFIAKLQFYKYLDLLKGHC